MSRENVDAVRGVYRAWAAGDVRGDPSLYDPYFVYLSEPGDPDPGPHYGLAASNAYFRRFLDSWDDWRMEATAYREVGDSVLVRVHLTGIGRGSRVPIEDHSLHVWTFRGTKAIRLQVFKTETEALEAVGLSE